MVNSLHCRQTVACASIKHVCAALPLLEFDNLAKVANCHAVVLQNGVQWIQAGHIGLSLTNVIKMIRLTI